MRFPPLPALMFGLVYFDFLAITTALALGFVLHENPTAYTGEGDFITWLSFVHLVVAGILAGCICRRRTAGKAQGCFWFRPGFCWALVSFGFFFLAVDEVAKIHESLDHLVHRAFEIDETGISDRLDDLFVLIYGLCGIAVLSVYKKEFLRFRAALPLLVAGGSLFLFMLVLDAVGNRNDVIVAMGVGHREGEVLRSWIGGIEEGLKLFAEAALLCSVYACLLQTADSRKSLVGVEV